jgi:hypothetical protein
MTGNTSGTGNDQGQLKKPVLMQKINELLQEFRTVFSGRTNTADTIIPPLLYALVNMLAGLLPATLSALILATILTVLRLVRKQSWLYAFKEISIISKNGQSLWRLTIARLRHHHDVGHAH